MRSAVLDMIECGFVSFTSLKDLNLVHKIFAKTMDKKMKVLLPNDCISGIYENNGSPNDIVHLLEDLIKEQYAIKTVDCLVGIHSSQLYREISQTDEVIEIFAGHAIYSIGALYSGYNQFQLATKSRNLTTIKTPLGLLHMCTLPQGGTNSVAHM